MKTSNIDTYWDYRAKQSFAYKGETFYTVTPIPFYYRRREILLQQITSIFESKSVAYACDFGCGDGHYLRILSERYPGVQWYGVDLSQSMIDKARLACPQATFQVSSNGIAFEQSFDLVYSIAVMAHVLDDEALRQLFANICSKLKAEGLFFLFEQTAPIRGNGETWCRRHTEEYLAFAEEAGLDVVEHRLVAFPLHRKFEKFASTILGRFGDSTKNHVLANRLTIYRWISSLALLLSGPPLRPDNGTLEGNSFYVFSKC